MVFQNWKLCAKRGARRSRLQKRIDGGQTRPNFERHYLKAASVADVHPKIIMASCPNCGGERKAYVRGEHVVYWSDEDSPPITSSNTAWILECCGCERIFFRRDFWFSEWGDHIFKDPYTGQLRREFSSAETTYWPSPVRRKEPEWIDGIEKADQTLGRLLSEMYAALNNDLRVLAAIGARTAFDRSSELLGVKADLPFSGKLDALVTIGKIGDDERKNLDVLVDAGSAAAHRGWRPRPEELTTIDEYSGGVSVSGVRAG